MGGLLICAALGVEARAVRRGLPAGAEGVRVVRVGAGLRRAARAATALPGHDALVVAGFCGALGGDLRPGDVLVADEVRLGDRVFPCPSAPLLAGELARAGLPARTGPLVTCGHVVTGAERRRLARGGAVAVDMETGPLAAAAYGRPLAAVRVVVDTPRTRLLGVATVRDGFAARRALRRIGPVLARWGAAAGPRRVLLAVPGAFLAEGERAIGTGAGTPAETGAETGAEVGAEVGAGTRATTGRGEAVRVLADEADLVLVVGPADSSVFSTSPVSRRPGGETGHATAVRFVGAPGDLALGRLAAARTIGLTALSPVSSPLVDAVVAALRGLGPVTVEERRVGREAVRFPFPGEVTS